MYYKCISKIKFFYLCGSFTEAIRSAKRSLFLGGHLTNSPDEITGVTHMDSRKGVRETIWYKDAPHHDMMELK